MLIAVHRQTIILQAATHHATPMDLKWSNKILPQCLWFKWKTDLAIFLCKRAWKHFICFSILSLSSSWDFHQCAECRGTNLSSLFLSDRIHLNAFTPLHSHQELKEFRRWNQLSLCVSVNFFFNLSYYLSRYRPCDKWKSMQAMLSKLLFYLQMHKDRVLSFVDFWFHHMVLTFLLWFQDEVFPIIKMIKEKVW